jgi:drug/metabolite transporter (DMT)-like permease
VTFDLIPAPLLAVVAAACFGAAIVVSKPALHEIPPLGGTLVSVPTTTLFLWLLSPFFLDLENFQISAVVVFSVVGIFFPALVSFLSFEANRRMGPTISSAISGRRRCSPSSAQSCFCTKKSRCIRRSRFASSSRG